MNDYSSKGDLRHASHSVAESVVDDGLGIIVREDIVSRVVHSTSVFQSEWSYIYRSLRLTY